MTPKLKVPTLPALLAHQADTRGERPVYTYLADGENESHTLTFGSLDLQARAIAARLQQELQAGDRALILTLSGLEFIRAFLGCQYAGVIPVPVSLPFPARSPSGMRTVCAIAGDCGARMVISDVPSDVGDALRLAAPELASLPWVAVEEVASELASELRAANVRGEDPAFLQYTSGSTAVPKGVIVTHEALMYNEALINHWMHVQDDDRFVSWLPLFHDMGLIGNVLQVLYAGVQAFLMPPYAFVQRPERWLRAISRYGGTISGGPNFGYELCARRVRPEDCEDLDLSSWRWAYNGAEPVRSSTLEAFHERFRPHGFDRRSLGPCYGLAESTLLAVGSERGRGPVQISVDEEELKHDRLVAGEDRVLVSSGIPMLYRRVEIVDPVTCRRLGQDEIGEIWLAGPDVARGYWGRDRESEQTFAARIADDGDGPFLRTGDLGALHGAHLYVTGRLKDLIIVAGRNHYPQDIEATVEEVHPRIRRGCCAAFAVECQDQPERVVVAAELRLDGDGEELQLDELRREIRAAVARAHDVNVAVVELLVPRSMPKTSSGKLQRSACRAAFESGQLASVELDLEQIA